MPTTNPAAAPGGAPRTDGSRPPGVPRAHRGLAREEVERLVDDLRQDLTVASFELGAIAARCPDAETGPVLDALERISARARGLLR